MSIMIKGMEMPTSCFYCPFRRKINPDDNQCLVTGDVFEETFAGTIEMRNRGFCPLVPVPPHGDLIDRKTAYDSLLDGMAMTGYQSRALDCISDFYVPTIIPAEEEDRNVE